MQINVPSYTVLIPAFNAQDTIAQLLDQLRDIPVPPAHMFVIDDGSTDNTRRLAEEHLATVFSFDTNQGKGRALQRGMQLFKKHTNDDFVICMDADLQHNPDDIEVFLEKKMDHSDTLIIGSRDIKIRHMPVMRFMSNKITSWILSALTQKKIRDSQCGFRLIPRNILKDNYFKEKGFQFESEFILWCSRHGIPIEFVNIPTIYNRQRSNINHIGDTLRFLRLAIMEFFKR